MNTKYFIFALLTLLVVACNNNKEKTDDSPWILVWEDNFDAEKLDTTNWSIIPRGKHDWNRYMSDYDGLYCFQDGCLVLRGIENSVMKDDTARFLTGGVYTKNKKTFGLGRLEIRAKLNPAKGAWPAIWMLPQDSVWPMGGEIDIMERLSHDKLVYQTVHSNYTQNLGIKDNPAASTAVGINPNDFNVYALEKYQDSLVFYVNDIRTKNYPRIETDKEGQFPFCDQEFYLIIDMQLGGSWVGNVNTNELPVDMYIDWVRFYEFDSSKQ